MEPILCAEMPTSGWNRGPEPVLAMRASDGSLRKDIEKAQVMSQEGPRHPTAVNWAATAGQLTLEEAFKDVAKGKQCRFNVFTDDADSM